MDTYLVRKERPLQTALCGQGTPLGYFCFYLSVCGHVVGGGKFKRIPFPWLPKSISTQNAEKWKNRRNHRQCQVARFTFSLAGEARFDEWLQNLSGRSESKRWGHLDGTLMEAEWRVLHSI